jgi:uncharacterized damage-inducible protein DinB
MNAPDVIRRLHQHRQWVNARLLDAAGQLPPEALTRHFNIGQGSIWKSLTHLFAAEWIWLEALLGNESPTAPGDLPGQLPGNQAAPGAMTTLDELKSNWTELNHRWNRYLADLQPETLEKTVYKFSTSSGAGKRWPTPAADVLLHVCTHAQYTTSQLVNMLRQSGATHLPDVMLITLARLEVPC